MSGRADEFYDHLSDCLKGILARVATLEKRIGDEREATRAGIQEAVDRAEAAFRKTKDDAEAAHVRMAACRGEVAAERVHDRVPEELEHGAEDAEAYAVWSVMVASGAIDETELAAMRAIAARMKVECSSHSSTPPVRSGKSSKP